MDAPPPRPSPSRRHLLGKLLLALAGLAVGLGAAELIFRFRDDAGFPKLNLYVEDAQLGVRLVPGGSQRLVYPGNPSTAVRINAQGYRGADLPAVDRAGGDDDVMIVGDSQVFGLGVEENETFAAVLEHKLAATPGPGGADRRVLNAGVPTYGPEEYAAVARELLAQRQPHPPRTVVFTINMVNDLFEAGRPNRERHAVRDGWAVRSDVAPQVTSFPGRSWLARRSHLFYAVRSLWHRDTDGQSAASEGTWKDLVASGAKSAQQQAALQQAQLQRSTERHQTEAALRRRATEVDEAIRELLADELSEDERNLLQSAHAQPGEYVVVAEPGLEEGRAVQITAEQIRRGAALRARLRARAERLAAKASPRLRERLLTGLTEEPKLAARLDELGLSHVKAALENPVAPAIRALKGACDAAGVRLVLLILPIDVAVSAEEWKKYGAPPLDLSGSLALHDEIAALGAELGVATLDATAALRAAEPGAFLHHDIHMTPRGHAAVAAALAETLAAPPPAPPAADLSPMPVPAQWNAAPEVVVAGSTAARCETKRIREWMRVLCLPREVDDGASAPVSLELVQNHARRAVVMSMPASTALTLALAPGDSLEAVVTWPQVVRRFTVAWPAGAKAPLATFQVLREEPRQPEEPRRHGFDDFDSGVARKLCACWQDIYSSQGSGLGIADQHPRCPGIYGSLDAGCLAYGSDCADLVACALLDPGSPPGGRKTPAAR
jgi:hypothetical protein